MQSLKVPHACPMPRGRIRLVAFYNRPLVDRAKPIMLELPWRRDDGGHECPRAIGSERGLLVNVQSISRLGSGSARDLYSSAVWRKEGIYDDRQRVAGESKRELDRMDRTLYSTSAGFPIGSHSKTPAVSGREI
nr:hypothetical protein CFP56_31688 [Quercus suber]